MEKRLPIKFFEKRIRDEQRTEGGGSQREDSWILHGDALTHRSQQLVSNMSQVAATFATRKQEKRKLPMVVATTIVEDAIAKSHRGQVVDLLDSDRKSNVIGIASAVQLDEPSNVSNPAKGDKGPPKSKETRRLLSVVTTDELILRIKHALQDTQNFAKLISAIAEIEPFEAQRVDYNPDNRLYRIRLIDYRDPHTNTLAQNLFKAKCHAHGIKIERETRYTRDMNLYRVSLDIDRSGTVARAPGTSFSTPWIARIVAELNHLLAEDFDPLLIKALMVHNAGYPAGKCMNMEDKIKFMGFGMPPGTRDILYNSEHEITLILRDSLPKSQFINILEFPFPKSLVRDDGFYRGQITLTVVSAPILRASEGAEYCQSDISVRFGTMTGIKRRDTSKPMILNPYGPENGANLLREDYYSKIVLGVTEEKAFAKERTLLRYGKKFHPIKKYAIDLDEMTAGNRKNLLGKGRKWYMRIEMLCREAIEREFRETREKLEQEFCVLLTIRDPEGKAPVYNEVTQQLQDRGFVYSDVKLKNEISQRVL